MCGHSCDAPCTSVCPPCTKRCAQGCEHSKCDHECGKPCVPCAEPCPLSCPHSECTKPCGQPCNRRPCNEPCPELLKCGHPCIGFCGDTCPQACRVCDKEDVTQIFFGSFPLVSLLFRTPHRARRGLQATKTNPIPGLSSWPHAGTSCWPLMVWTRFWTSSSTSPAATLTWPCPRARCVFVLLLKRGVQAAVFGFNALPGFAAVHDAIKPPRSSLQVHD